MSTKEQEQKTILAIDYGTKATGLALFTLGKDPFPMPYGKIKYIDDQQLCTEILKVIDDEVVDQLIIGLPLFTDGTESEMTKQVKKFAYQLHTMCSIPIIFQDETLTTYEAEQRMMNSPRYNFKVDPKQIDALAASIILEDFLSNPNKGTPLE